MTVSALRRSIMTLFSVADDLYSHRVRIVLAEKDIASEIEDVDPQDLPEDILHLNPYNSTPMLVDRDLVLYDSRVIVEYLDERFPHPPLMPVDPVSRAKTRLTMHRIERDWLPLIDQIENGGEKKRAEAKKQLRDSLVASGELFSAMPFFLSEELSILDVTLAPVLWRLPHYGVELPKAGKAIDDYANRLFERQGFQDSLTQVEREMR
ncbi:MAG: glutathione S-transferase N-terminal domain-containing protein [Gammaproteobacteria bacterium]|nr:glutathione S-transferase N-terminal domain-containing protein [Gammaproteobacteria bacterium]